jgi:hypothetical protein
MATSTSWPLPDWIDPALVFTVPETLASFALLLELDPTMVSVPSQWPNTL